MATCNAQTLLDSGKCFAVLSPGELLLVQVQLLVEILLQLDADHDVTPATLLDEAKCYATLTPFQLRLLIAQLLCEIYSQE